MYEQDLRKYQGAQYKNEYKGLKMSWDHNQSQSHSYIQIMSQIHTKL